LISDAIRSRAEDATERVIGPDIEFPGLTWLLMVCAAGDGLEVFYEG
jgi:hypothetical protein